MIRTLVLVSLVGLSACAALEGPARNTRGVRSSSKAVVSLPKVGSEPFQAEAVVEESPATIGAPNKPPSRSRRFEIESTALTRAFARPRTLGAEVVLPEGFRPDEQLAIAYHVPDIGEDPAEVAERFANLEKRPRLVLVVLDPRGIHGHHAFVDSVNEGPYGEALVTDLIPVLEQHLFAGTAVRRRYLTGVGLGGWSVVHLQLDYSHAFDSAYALEPEPLDQSNFYGCDLTSLWRGEDSSAGPARRLQMLREANLRSMLSSWESALGARGDDGLPLPLFEGPGGQFDADVVNALRRHDPTAFVRQRGAALAPRLGGKIHAVAVNGDVYGRELSMRSFATALDSVRVAGVFRTVDVLDIDEAMIGVWASMTTPPKP